MAMTGLLGRQPWKGAACCLLSKKIIMGPGFRLLGLSTRFESTLAQDHLQFLDDHDNNQVCHVWVYYDMTTIISFFFLF